MKINDSILNGYENTKLVHYNELPLSGDGVVKYEDLPNQKVFGVLKSCRLIDGKLFQTYSEKENHVGVIAATRLGKTTSYVIPTVLSYAKAQNKRSMIISDPKGELYRITSETLRQEGYEVKMLNFRDYMHSECWNPLTPIFRMYQRAIHLVDEVEVVATPNGPRNSFRGIVYDNQKKLDDALKRMERIAIEDVGNEIDKLASMIVVNTRQDDPYWEDCARDLLKAGIWAMLEDSVSVKRGCQKITEETFSFSTLLSIMDGMHDGDGTYYDDGGYFSNRPKDSRAYILAKNCILENGRPTRKCIVSSFNSKLSIYKNSAVRIITSCNSFEMDELVKGDKPIAFFINYQDESKAHYPVISSFVQNAYNFLIGYANEQPNGKLDSQFYFILDEFGNFPRINDFETVISACGGRNIFFMLILQSYAQLDNVYGREIAEIIRDNLNVHVFIGSNNPSTLTEFSRECGETTRIAPVSALVGGKSEIEHFQVETIPLMPKSVLSSLKIGECIVTEANCGYVMFSKLERYYVCEEMNHLPTACETDYCVPINPLDEKYVYVRKEENTQKNASPRNFFAD